MLKKLTALASLAFLLCGGAAAQSSDSKPTQLYGLGDVRVIAISPDHRFLASAGQAGAFLWDLPSGTFLHRLQTPGTVIAIAFSTDSETLFTASRGTIRAWDTLDGSPIRDYVGHSGDINRLQVSTDDKILASAGADNTARIWSVETGDQLHSVRVPRSSINDLALSPDGQTLVTIDSYLTNSVKIWDIATESQLGALPTTNLTTYRCIFRPNGELLITGADRSVVLWNADTGQQIRSFQGITNSTSIALDLWFPNNDTLAATCTDGSIFLWNFATTDLLKAVEGDPVFATTGAPGDFLTASSHVDYNIRLRQLPGGETIRTFKGHTTSSHSAVAFSPDGKYILSAGSEGATRLWNRQTAEPVREFIGSPAGTVTAAFSSDGSKILTTIGLPNPSARLWKTETGEIVRDFAWTGSWPISAALSKDESKIAVGAQDLNVRIFDTATGALLHTLSHTSWPSRLSFSPAAPLLATGSADSIAIIYNHQTGQRIHDFFANAGPISAVQFSPNGDTLLIAWQDGLIRLYSTSTFELRKEFFVQFGFLDSAAYSPDGQYIITGESFPNFVATIWDAETAEPLRNFPGHNWVIGSAAFSPDGSSLLTGADLIREWNITDLATRLKIQQLDNQIQLRWTTGQLERASQPEGPWQSQTNVTSPLTIPANAPAEFYRVRTAIDVVIKH
jgi:WD40 repeat protein